MARLTYSNPIRIHSRWHYSNRNRLGDLQKQSTQSDLFKTLLHLGRPSQNRASLNYNLNFSAPNRPTELRTSLKFTSSWRQKDIFAQLFVPTCTTKKKISSRVARTLLLLSHHVQRWCQMCLFLNDTKHYSTRLSHIQDMYVRSGHNLRARPCAFLFRCSWVSAWLS